MSSTATATTGRSPATPDPAISRVPFSRLLRVEVRKVRDTRAGFWLLVAIGVLTAVIITIFLFAENDLAGMTYRTFFFVTATPQGFLLPVLAILAVTAEWSQRTGLVTFTLEPSRMRVVAAKLVAVCLYGMLAIALALALAALGNLLGMSLRDGAGDWDITGAFLRDMTVLQLSGLVQGFAFGLVFMNTAAAIVVYFILPTLWSVLFSLVGWLADIAPWVDLNTATGPIFEGDLTGEDWAHIAVASTIWVLVPLLLGLWRLTHSEVKSA
jgi:ABC-2 type transport system permease protein